ncbi:MAG: ABC transporter substrate-binding protein [Magnetococcus sp. WYHC-3]
MNTTCRISVVKALTYGLVLAIGSASACVLAGEPTDQLKETTDKILAIVRDPTLQGADKEDARQKQMREEIDKRFAWSDMAHSAYGLAWNKLTDAQRTEFTGLFGDLVNKNYMSKVESYSGEKIQYKGDKVDGTYGVVNVVIVTLRNTDIAVSYRVLKKDTQWLIYDVIIENISMVNNYRSQFGAILHSSPHDVLVSRIKAKIAANTPEPTEKKTGTTVDPKKADGAL